MQSDLFGVGSVLWETLTSERLFDGKTDIEIFKKIRVCKIPPITDYRDDLPAALLAVLDVALSADPANRYATAEEFAQALGQVMKQAVGVNPATALGAAVQAARKAGGAGDSLETMPVSSDTIDQTATTAEHQRPKRESVDVEFSETIDIKPPKK